MPAPSPRTPCIVGAAQAGWRDRAPAPEPLAMWEQVARDAAADTGADARAVLGRVDSVDVVYCQSWQYDDPPGRVRERLGIPAAARTAYSGIGGTVPQTLVAGASEAILAGELDLALIVGGEALATRRRLKKSGERPDWSHPVDGKRPFPLEQPPTDTELAHEVYHAYTTFALLDAARRGRSELGFDAYHRMLGDQLAPMTERAADNPVAWFPTARSAEELITPTDANRMVAFPYTKYMTATMNVDMAGALLVASTAAADALGVAPERRVHPRGWAYAEDAWSVAARHDLARSPALAAAGRAALDMAGAGAGDLGPVDLYSCFTSSVLFARDALGLDLRRPATVTGGLPFFGGPGSAYMLLSVAELAARLRADPGSVGLASGVGMHMTKHAVGVYSTTPGSPTPVDAAALQDAVDADHPEREVVDAHAGEATVAAYTVLHARSGEPERGVAVCDLPDGRRCYATIDQPELLTAAEAGELVGEAVSVVADDGVNRIKT